MNTNTAHEIAGNDTIVARGLSPAEVDAAKAIAELLAPGWAAAETSEPVWGSAYQLAVKAVMGMRETGYPVALSATKI